MIPKPTLKLSFFFLLLFSALNGFCQDHYDLSSLKNIPFVADTAVSVFNDQVKTGAIEPITQSQNELEIRCYTFYNVSKMARILVISGNKDKMEAKVISITHTDNKLSPKTGLTFIGHIPSWGNTYTRRYFVKPKESWEQIMNGLIANGLFSLQSEAALYGKYHLTTANFPLSHYLKLDGAMVIYEVKYNNKIRNIVYHSIGENTKPSLLSIPEFVKQEKLLDILSSIH
ncbi:hypothetical protein [Mucilaginibacter sp. L196]|uniref:hypothetical protein n=1 Tax=Mucilaginibacter sp. L196 TaxID=1641870 RepID=UPI00131CB853|nr:hypothetical protein [Mucilaginibacter sp. L196]